MLPPVPAPKSRLQQSSLSLCSRVLHCWKAQEQKNTRQSTALNSKVSTIIFSIITKSLWTVRSIFFIIQTVPT